MSMQMEFIKVLPSPQALMEDYPISQASKMLKLQRDEEIKNIFTGKDDRFLMVIGPCSSDNEDAVLDYVHRLAKVQEKVKIKSTWCRACTPISPAPSAWAIRVCCTSPLQMVRRICWAALSPSAR